MPSADPLVIVPDARFGGGGQAMIDAFVSGARTLGREPSTISPGFVPAVDGIHQHWAARGVSRRARTAESVWVVAAAAPYGAGAAASGRPYACWLATSLEDEWAARASALSATRRLVHAVNAPLLRRLERIVLAKATAVYGISPASRAALARAADRPDVGVLPIPVDLAHFAPEPDERWAGRLDAPTVVFVGRGDDPRKNVDLLLDAWPRIQESLPTARLKLVGRPPNRSLPPGAECKGVVADVAAELRTGALFVLPSRQEGFGIVVAESLACGVPVVSTPCRGPEDMLRESGGGVILRDFDAEELAASVLYLLGSRDTLTSMRRAGRAYVERKHSRDVFYNRLQELLR